MTLSILGADTAAVITSLTGLVSAVGAIVVVYLQYRIHVRVKDVQAVSDLTAVAVSSPNGATLGETVAGIGDAVNANPTPIFHTGEQPATPGPSN